MGGFAGFFLGVRRGAGRHEEPAPTGDEDIPTPPRPGMDSPAILDCLRAGFCRG